MKNSYFLVIAILFVSGCNSVPQGPKVDVATATPVSLTKEQIAKVKSGVARGLKDPESARFDELMRASEDGSNIHVCGYVNAKNSYGGYTGSKQFYATGIKPHNIFTLMIVGDTDAAAEVTAKECKKFGL